MTRRAPADQRRARRLGRRLVTVADSDPGCIRRRVLETVLQTVEADGAVFYMLGAADGQYYASCAQGIGAEAIGQAVANIQGPRGCEGLNNTQMRDYSRPSRLERTSFVEEGALWEREAFLEGLPYKTILAPFGLRHQQRLLAYHGLQFVGWVGLLRGRGTSPFCLEERQRLQPLVQPVITALLTAERMERAAQPAEAGDIVVDTDGHVLHASRPGRAWLEQPGFAEGIARAVRALDKDPSACHSTTIVVGSAWARIVRLDGTDGVRYLLHTQPLEALTQHPDTPLSSRQRQVAYQVATGATLREVAEALGISAETARCHLRAVYQKLEVANRVELASALLQPDDM